jgi:hypothetical protein
MAKIGESNIQNREHIVNRLFPSFYVNLVIFMLHTKVS